MIQTKEALYALAMEQLETKLCMAEAEISSARKASENETKSSAGDKYETSREMLQQEIRMSQAQLFETQKLKHALLQINPTKPCASAGTGALLHTSLGNFYISISLGQVFLDSIPYQLISSNSPIARALEGVAAGQSINFNQRKIDIQSVY